MKPIRLHGAFIGAMLVFSWGVESKPTPKLNWKLEDLGLVLSLSTAKRALQLPFSTGIGESGGKPLRPQISVPRVEQIAKAFLRVLYLEAGTRSQPLPRR